MYARNKVEGTSIATAKVVVEVNLSQEEARLLFECLDNGYWDFETSTSITPSSFIGELVEQLRYTLDD